MWGVASALAIGVEPALYGALLAACVASGRPFFSAATPWVEHGGVTRKAFHVLLVAFGAARVAWALTELAGLAFAGDDSACLHIVAIPATSLTSARAALCGGIDAVALSLFTSAFLLVCAQLADLIVRGWRSSVRLWAAFRIAIALLWTYVLSTLALSAFAHADAALQQAASQRARGAGAGALSVEVGYHEWSFCVFGAYSLLVAGCATVAGARLVRAQHGHGGGYLSVVRLGGASSAVGWFNGGALARARGRSGGWPYSQALALAGACVCCFALRACLFAYALSLALNERARARAQPGAGSAAAAASASALGPVTWRVLAYWLAELLPCGCLLCAERILVSLKVDSIRAWSNTQIRVATHLSTRRAARAREHESAARADGVWLRGEAAGERPVVAPRSLSGSLGRAIWGAAAAAVAATVSAGERRGRAEPRSARAMRCASVVDSGGCCATAGSNGASQLDAWPRRAPHTGHAGERERGYCSEGDTPRALSGRVVGPWTSFSRASAQEDAEDDGAADTRWHGARAALDDRERDGGEAAGPSRWRARASADGGLNERLLGARAPHGAASGGLSTGACFASRPARAAPVSVRAICSPLAAAGTVASSAAAAAVAGLRCVVAHTAAAAEAAAIAPPSGAGDARASAVYVLRPPPPQPPRLSHGSQTQSAVRTWPPPRQPPPVRRRELGGDAHVGGVPGASVAAEPASRPTEQPPPPPPPASARLLVLREVLVEGPLSFALPAAWLFRLLQQRQQLVRALSDALHAMENAPHQPCAAAGADEPDASPATTRGGARAPRPRETQGASVLRALSQELRGERRQSGPSWVRAQLMKHGDHCDQLLRLLDLSEDYGGQAGGLWFKPSTRRADKALSCIPINLHIHYVHVLPVHLPPAPALAEGTPACAAADADAPLRAPAADAAADASLSSDEERALSVAGTFRPAGGGYPGSLHLTVTAGAPAAHSLGFKRGGVHDLDLRLQRVLRKLEMCQQQLQRHWARAAAADAAEAGGARDSARAPASSACAWPDRMADALSPAEQSARLDLTAGAAAAAAAIAAAVAVPFRWPLSADDALPDAELASPSLSPSRHRAGPPSECTAESDGDGGTGEARGSDDEELEATGGSSQNGGRAVAGRAECAARRRHTFGATSPCLAAAVSADAMRTPPRRARASMGAYDEGRHSNSSGCPTPGGSHTYAQLPPRSPRFAAATTAAEAVAAFQLSAAAGSEQSVPGTPSADSLALLRRVPSACTLSSAVDCACAGGAGADWSRARHARTSLRAGDGAGGVGGAGSVGSALSALDDDAPSTSSSAPDLLGDLGLRAAHAALPSAPSRGAAGTPRVSPCRTVGAISSSARGLPLAQERESARIAVGRCEYLSKKAQQLRFERMERLDDCLAQAITIVGTAITAQLHALLHAAPDEHEPSAQPGAAAADAPSSEGARAAGGGGAPYSPPRALSAASARTLRQWARVGALVGWESVLSTAGAEAGMLSDMIGCVHELRRQRLGFCCARADARSPHAVWADEAPHAAWADEAPHARAPTVPRGSAAPAADSSAAEHDASRSQQRWWARESARASAAPAAASGTKGAAPGAPACDEVGAHVGFRAWRWARQGAWGDALEGTLALPDVTVSAHGPPDSRLLLCVQLPSHLFELLPAELQGGRHIDCTLALFSQGINVAQNFVSAVGSPLVRLQERVNAESLVLLSAHVRAALDAEAHDVHAAGAATLSSVGIFEASRHTSSRAGLVLAKLQRLAHLVAASRNETHVDILLLGEELVRQLRGVRITSCKSAKDRTAMSVTAEHASILASAHGLSAADAERLAARMRREGVRLHNARKNTGRSLYAFSRLQRQWLPERYAPPEGTYARGRT